MIEIFPRVNLKLIKIVPAGAGSHLKISDTALFVICLDVSETRSSWFKSAILTQLKPSPEFVQ